MPTSSAGPTIFSREVALSDEPNKSLMKRVAAAMDAVLAREPSMTWPKLLVELDCLAPKDLDAWRRGRVPYLERVIRMNLSKLSRVQTAVQRIARERGLVRRLDAASPKRPYSKTRNPFVEAEYGMVYQRPTSRPPEGSARIPEGAPPAWRPLPAEPRSAGPPPPSSPP